MMWCVNLNMVMCCVDKLYVLYDVVCELYGLYNVLCELECGDVLCPKLMLYGALEYITT
jgi:hypothetical protein